MQRDNEIRFERSNFSLLRFLGMLIIFIHHYTLINGHTSVFSSPVVDDLLNVVFDRGFYVNFMFFTLSGYCLNRAYTYHTDRLYKVSFKSFIKRRFLSLYPGAAISIVITGGLLYLWFFSFNDYWLQNSFAFYHIPAALVGLQAYLTSVFGDSINNPTWFVFMLILCQISFWLLGRIRNIDRKLVLVLSTLISYMLYHMVDHFDLERLLYSHFCFFLGCTVEYFSRTRKNRTIVGIIIAAICVVFCTYPFYLMLFLPSLLIIAYEDIAHKLNRKNALPELTKLMKDISFPILLMNFPAVLIINYIDRAYAININYSSVLIILATFIVNVILALPVLRVQRTVSGRLNRS